MPVFDEQRKIRWRRVLKRRQKDALILSQQADKGLEKHLINRFDKLASVRRFVFLWVVLFIILIFSGVYQYRTVSSYYQTLQPVSGGLYTEGLIGTFTNANPIYASGSANVAISRLVFSGLFKYDQQNNLTGDLAQSWTLDPTQKHYTVSLKPNIKWQDGKKFTADDVVFTYSTIQNFQAQSSLYSSWKDIKVSKIDKYHVSFDLPNALSAFPFSLTNGIIPEHILGGVKPEQLRSASFNTQPIGTGPFLWKFVEVTNFGNQNMQQRMSLTAYDRYWAGRPKLDGFSIIAFKSEDQMLSAFKKKQLNAMSGLGSLPDELANSTEVHTFATPLTSLVMAFFRTSAPILSDVKVRQALTAGVDHSQLSNQFNFPSQLSTSPLLRGQLGYDPSIKQQAFDTTLANQLLDQAGWTRNAEGQRVKAGQILQMNLSSQDSQEYSKVAGFLQKSWQQLGVKVNVNYYSPDDLQRFIIGNHDYDILLYGISLGVDPDVFTYWDSSQASVSSQSHLNLSEYKSGIVDQAIESARTRSDPATRATKYKVFLANWVKDAPAISLYQPNYLYVVRGNVFNFERTATNSSVDRYYNVDNWMVRQQKKSD